MSFEAKVCCIDLVTISTQANMIRPPLLIWFSDLVVVSQTVHVFSQKKHDDDEIACYIV